MKKKNYFYILFLCTFSIIALIFIVKCKKDPSPQKTFITSFPTSPINFGATINSIYDDYNSAAQPPLGGTFPLCFSSNRNSQGNNFDIIFKLLDVYSVGGQNSLTIGGETDTTSPYYNDNKDLINALAIINTSFDEYGPYFVPSLNLQTANITNGRIILYANNSGGNLDIKFVTNVNLQQQNPLPQYSQPKAINYLNSNYDDAYPSITKTNSCIYFCSNRGGNFDIYKV